MMNRWETNGLGLNVVHLNGVHVNGGVVDGEAGPPPSDMWFRFDVTPLDSGYKLIS